MIAKVGRGTALVLVAAALAGGGRLAAAPPGPMAFKGLYEQARKDAEVVAQVRVVSAVCTEAAGEKEAPTVTLQLALQVLDAEKGPAKMNDVIVISRKVSLPTGAGPGAYGYMAAVEQCPFDPGVKGSVALRWDKEQRRYQLIAGWVPGRNGAAIPREVGKAAVAGDEVPRVEPAMRLSDESLEKRISQSEQARSSWKWLALGQLLLLAVVIVAGVATSTMMVVRARQAEMIAREEARRAQEAEVQDRQQAEEAARAAEAEHRARQKDRK
jgi:hypothetical protein